MNIRKAILGSARLQRAGERVLAIANFSAVFNAQDVAMHKGRLFRRDAETSTRAACAPRIPPLQPKGLFGL
jgi:hypothetical protein